MESETADGCGCAAGCMCGPNCACEPDDKCAPDCTCGERSRAGSTIRDDAAVPGAHWTRNVYATPTPMIACVSA
jgi:hypothetical protein